MSERIERLGREEAAAAAAEVGIHESLADIAVFQILLKNPGVAAALSGSLTALLWKGRLDPRLRELVIMRIGWSTGSMYEWTQHWRVATGIGMDEADILSVRDWRNHDDYGPAERAVLAATDESLSTGVISDDVWASCQEHVGGDDILIELVVAIGNWTLFSSMLRTLRVPLDEGLEPWPPDGLAP